jgi:arylsulfatase A-like enzyme
LDGDDGAEALMKKGFFGYVLAGALGGVAAGGLAGLFEGVSIWLGEPSEGALAPLYGAVFYAVLLGLGGVCAGVVGFGGATLLKRTEMWDARWVWTASFVALLVPVAMVVTRFRVIRDVFHEKLAMASVAGVGVHIGILAGGAILAAVVWWLTSPRGKGPLRGKSAAGLTAVVFGGALAVSLPFTALGGEEAPGVVKNPKDTPPVILIMVDTLRADHLQSYGYRGKNSPNLAKFADDSVQFDQAIANASWTRPSTASLLTGLPPSGHKTMYKADRLPDAVDSVAEVFLAGGHPTGGIVTNYNIAPYFNFGQGFLDYQYLEPDYYFWADGGSSKLSLYNVVRVLREKVAPASDNPDFYYRDAAQTTDAAIAWMGPRREQGFFLFLTYMDPHDPYFARPLSGESYSRAANTNPDPKLAARFREIYDGEIQYFDAHFGRLVEWLKKEGIYDRAAIVVTSDHGEEFQEHGGWWHGTTLYEEQIHVPLIIKLPGGEDAGDRRDDLAALLDVPPTLAAIAGLKPADSWVGRDLFGKGDAPEAVLSEEDHQGNVLKSLRGSKWKLITANEGNPRGLGRTELYNLEDDPGEAKNRDAEKPEVMAAMAKGMDDAAKGLQGIKIERDQMEVDAKSKELLEKLGYIEK